MFYPEISRPTETEPHARVRSAYPLPLKQFTARVLKLFGSVFSFESDLAQASRNERDKDLYFYWLLVK